MKRKIKSKILIFIILITFVFYIGYKCNKKPVSDIEVVSKIDNYNYSLDNNETRIYKKNYKELEKLLKNDKIDEKEYAIQISKLFLMDFYNLNNKITNQDVGGLQFLCSNIKDNFYDKAVNTMYKYIKSNIYGNRHQSLPEVKDVEILDIKNIKFDENKIKDDNGYEVNAKIKYKRDLGYSEGIILRIIHENNKLVIVEIEEK